jgi:hypothetical protein
MQPRQVKIYTHKIVPRLTYITGIIFNEILGVPHEIVTDKRKLGRHAVVNYSEDQIKDSFHINPDSLLFETGITQGSLMLPDGKTSLCFFRQRRKQIFLSISFQPPFI